MKNCVIFNLFMNDFFTNSNDEIDSTPANTIGPVYVPNDFGSNAPKISMSSRYYYSEQHLVPVSPGPCYFPYKAYNPYKSQASTLHERTNFQNWLNIRDYRDYVPGPDYSPDYGYSSRKSGMHERTSDFTNPRGSILTIEVGKTGAKMGKSLWELYSSEHCIQKDGTQSLESFEFNNYNDHNLTSEVLFFHSPTGKFNPNTLFIDFDSESIDNFRRSDFGTLFQEDNFYSIGEGGATISHSNEIFSQKSDEIFQKIRKIIERCDYIEGLQLLFSPNGATGSSISANIATVFKDVFPKTPIFFYKIANALDEVSPWNEIESQYYSISNLFQNKSLSIYFDYKKLEQKAYDLFHNISSISLLDNSDNSKGNSNNSKGNSNNSKDSSKSGSLQKEPNERQKQKIMGDIVAHCISSVTSTRRLSSIPRSNLYFKRDMMPYGLSIESICAYSPIISPEYIKENGIRAIPTYDMVLQNVLTENAKLVSIEKLTLKKHIILSDAIFTCGYFNESQSQSMLSDYLKTNKSNYQRQSLYRSALFCSSNSPSSLDNDCLGSVPYSATCLQISTDLLGYYNLLKKSFKKSRRKGLFSKYWCDLDTYNTMNENFNNYYKFFSELMDLDSKSEKSSNEEEELSC